MSNVVDINRMKTGETAFMLCSCLPEGTPYLTVAIVKDNPVIIGMVCPECETELSVVNGVISHEQR